jgi:hypothetical protein
MAEQPRKPSKPESKPEKKKTETVHLSPEELRSIAGGTKASPPPPLQPSGKKGG